MKILTNKCPTPLPNRNFDWKAWLEDTEGRPTGYGATEQSAIDDLKRILDE